MVFLESEWNCVMGKWDYWVEWDSWDRWEYELAGSDSRISNAPLALSSDYGVIEMFINP